MLPIMYTSVKYTYITNTTVLKKYWQLCLEANSILYDSMTAEYDFHNWQSNNTLPSKIKFL